MRQLNKTQTTSGTNISIHLSKTIMKTLTLDGGKPSLHNRISGPFGCLVVPYFSFVVISCHIGFV